LPALPLGSRSNTDASTAARIATATTTTIIVAIRPSPAFFDSQQCLNFLPLPQGQESFRPTFVVMPKDTPDRGSYRLPRRPWPRNQSMLQIPDPRVAMKRKMKAYSAASSPPFSTGQVPFG